MSTTRETMQGSLDWTVEALAQYLQADFAFLRRNDHVNGVSILLAEYPQRERARTRTPRRRALRQRPDLRRQPRPQDRRWSCASRTRRTRPTPSGWRRRGRGHVLRAGVPLVYGDVTEGCLAFVGWRTWMVRARAERAADGGVPAGPPDPPARDGGELAAAGPHRRADRAPQPPGAAGRGGPAAAQPGGAAGADLPRPRPVQGDERLPRPRGGRQGAGHHRRPDPRLDRGRGLRRPPRRATSS